MFCPTCYSSDTHRIGLAGEYSRRKADPRYISENTFELNWRWRCEVCGRRFVTVETLEAKDVEEMLANVVHEAKLRRCHPAALIAARVEAADKEAQEHAKTRAVPATEPKRAASRAGRKRQGLRLLGFGFSLPEWDGKRYYATPESFIGEQFGYSGDAAREAGAKILQHREAIQSFVGGGAGLVRPRPEPRELPAGRVQPLRPEQRGAVDENGGRDGDGERSGRDENGPRPDDREGEGPLGRGPGAEGDGADRGDGGRVGAVPGAAAGSGIARIDRKDGLTFQFAMPPQSIAAAAFSNRDPHTGRLLPRRTAHIAKKPQNG